MSKLRRQLLLSDPSYTVQKLVNKGILAYTEKAENGLLQRDYAFSKIYKKPFKKIKDFTYTFFDTHKTDNLFDEFRLTIDYSKGYLTKEQVDELIEIINTTPHYQKLNFSFRLNLGKKDFTDKDIILNLYNDNYYQMNTDMFSGSDINSVTFNIAGNGSISVLQNMFRWSGCKTIKFSKPIKPTDISGWCEGNNILTSHPNNIDYSVCKNIGYAWELCSALTELPSYYTVTDEASRLSTSANIIGGSAEGGIAFCDQAFNTCRVLQKIGPVLNLASIEPDSSQKLPLTMFNDSLNIKDIRLKNIGNGDWNFIRTDYRGLPNMDLASIKYCIENLARQSDYSFIPYGVIDIDTPTYGWSTLVQSTTKSLMYRRTNGNGKFFNITGDYKVVIPEGLTMKIVWWIGNIENPYNKAYNEFTYIVGDGQEHTFTNTLNDYQWCTIEIQKTDGSDLTNDTLHQILLYNNIEFYIGDNTTNYIIPTLHNIYFDTTYKSQIEARDVITPEIIQTANDKGWTIYIGETELTPSSS